MDDFRRPRPNKLNTSRPNQTFEPVVQAPRTEPVQVDERPVGDDPFLPKLKGPKRKFQFKLPTPKSKKQWVIFGVITALVLGATGFAIYWFIIRDTTPPVTYVAPEPEPEPEPVATTGPSVVSGREVPLNEVQKPIYAVQIENSPEARPQSGLIDADIVSEAVSEGGITRFNAIFHDKVPANIGPVRSLRPYYIDWFLPYKAGIVHAGGSAQALAELNALHLQDMNHNSTHFRRVSNRYAPHNLYTTGAQMVDLFTSKGYSNGTVPSLPRKAAAPSETPNASTVNVRFSRDLYNVSFAWDKTTNTYLRSLGGAPHKDADSGAQIAPNVVVVPVLSWRKDGIYSVYGTTGTGKVFIFQDGTVTEGTWTKPTRESQWQFTDASGAEIKLNPGQTWFSMADSAGAVTYQ